ncbi:MAG: hypothetical protein C0402_09065 [Thermodesulfovibrio sp.]|nr:hypothetical protein [Thermodesulfovibrio sp.]
MKTLRKTTEREYAAMKKLNLIFLMTLLVCGLAGLLPVQAKADEGWPQRIGGDYTDIARATAVDDNGNIYVVGSFQGTVVFGNPSSAEASKFTLASNGGSDMFVGKIDAGGKWLWVVKGGGTGEDLANAIAVDKDGDVYVTGSFQPPAIFGSTPPVYAEPAIPNQNIDVFVAKISTNGNWVWVNTAKGEQEQLGTAIAVNKIKEVFVAGTFRLNIRFSVDGSNHELTTKSYTGDKASNDYDVFVAKINAGGEWKWALSGGGTFPGISCLSGNWCCNSPNAAYGHDHGGYYYSHPVCGGWSNWGLSEDNCRRYYGGSVQYYPYTAPFTTTLPHPTNLNWDEGITAPAFGAASPASSAVQDIAAAYLYSPRTGVCDLSPTGTRVSDDRAAGIAVVRDESSTTTSSTPNPKNIIYVTGYFQGGVNTTSPQTYDFSISDNRSAQTGVACPGCVTKHLNSSGNGKKDIFVLRLVEVGTSLIGTPPPANNPKLDWIVDSSSSAATDEIWPNGIAIDPALDPLFGNPTTINLFVTGGYKGAPSLGAQLRATGGDTHAFVAKLTGSGDTSASWGWSRSAGPTDAGFSAEGFSVGADRMAPDTRGVYVTGSFRKDLNFYGDALPKTSLALSGYGTEKDLFVTKYNAGSGELQWATKGGLYQTDESRGIAIDGGGSSFVVGTFGSTASYLSKAASSLISGSAMNFNGLDEYVFGPTPASTDKYAISFWFKTDCNNCGILSWSSNPIGPSDRDLWLINGNLRAAVSGETIQTGGTDYSDGRWHHVVHTFGDIGSVPPASIGQRLFVDGMERGRGSIQDSTFVYSLPGPGINIGYSARGTSPYFSGMISNLEVYDRAMDNIHVNPANPDSPFSLYSDLNNQPNSNSSGKVLFTSGPAPLEDIFVASLGPTGKWRESETWTVGQVVPMPEGAVAIRPEFAYPTNPENPADLMYFEKFFFWSDYEKKLYSIRPTGAVIKWKASADVFNSARVVTTGVSNWPDNPQTHIAGIPVEVAPGSPDYVFSQLSYTNTTAPVATVTKNTKTTLDELISSSPGYTVLRYGIGSQDVTRNPVIFKVVKTVYWDDPNYLTDNAACTVGDRITDYSHNDSQGRNGYVYFNKSFHDGYGTYKAYDRETRTGPIIPVNEVSSSYTPDTHATSQGSGHDMVVVWYDTDTMKISWPVRPVRYDCQWSANPYKIIIASELGSDVLSQPPLDPLVYPEAQVYRQADNAQAGYNPNEEHAALFPSATGNGYDAAFALRNDLYNPARDLPSKPYVLLKYRNPADKQWSMLVYKVLDRSVADGYTAFNYQGTAGTPIFPPYPLRLLNGCTETTGDGSPYWQDAVNDQYWARSAGTVGVSYYYPLLLGFDYADYNTGGVASDPTNFNGTVGQCVGWLDRTDGVTRGNPISVSYNISWPADVPVLQIGETLLTAKRGLPDITNQAAIQIVYDQLDPDISDPNNALVQLIDPLNPREVQLKDSTGKLLDLPADIITSNDSGKLVFDDLPFHLQVRVYYNPLTHTLGFKGYFDGTGMGDPLLLVNVMSSNELDELLAISSDENYKDAVKKLFNLTRNPQQLRLTPPPIIIPSPWGPFPWPVMRPLVPHAADLSNWETLTAAQKRARLTAVPSLIGLQDENNNGTPERLNAVGGGFALTAGTAAGSGFVTLVFNNDPALGSLPVSMQVIRVECTPSVYQGEIKVIQSSNVFDEKLTLRHSGDFGGMPERFRFEWYYHPDQSGLSPVPPPSPETFELHGWLPFAMSDPEGYGSNDIIIKGASLQTLSDNWFYVRYKGYPVCSNTTVPSPWAGAPGATASNPSAQLAEGWIKRVVRALNPYEARVKDFSAATNTSLSMLTQIGERYEGVVAMNNDPDNLNSMGLISAYQTVLKRGIDLSIGGTPPINYEAANAALLLAGSRITDFYMLLGNEAYGDAADPTIGFTTTGGGYGNEATSMFAFKNQLDSQLEEELVLLRGREYKAARPVYNRLVWNFTSGEGEVAYAQNYGITDQNKDGFIDEFDARIMYPQGHGDAWGHYLTSLKGYYTLLRHPYYSWNPRPEAVLVAGAPVQVDYLDERKFARVAAAKAKAGAEIMNLTYRLKYVDDPAGQWQGYKDTDVSRGWGLTEWGRRVGQGTYFDWVVANSILRAVDLNPAHTGIQKIDRTTVLELQDIPRQFYSVQSQVDMADAGLNPLGLARNAVPFDIDPTFPTNASGMQGMTHFDQIYQRANIALSNAVDVFDYANRSTQRLRENQKNMDDFTNSIIDQEYDYQMRLIEIYGFPYSGDMGPTGTYPSDYTGADLYHYMWMDQSELTGVDGLIARPGDKHVAFPTINSVTGASDYPPTVTDNISYVYSSGGGGVIVKPSENMGVRRAQGEMQRALSTFYQERANYEVAIREYDNVLVDVQAKVKELEALSGYQATSLALKSVKYVAGVALSAIAKGLESFSIGFKAAAECVEDVAEPIGDAPSNLVVTAVGGGTGDVPKGVVKAVAKPTKCGLNSTGSGFEIGKIWAEFAKDTSDGLWDMIVEGVSANYELNKAAREVKDALKAEPVARLQAITQKEVLMQALENIKNVKVQGEKLLSELQYMRSIAASSTQQYRYQDMSFRIFRNDALQKYRAHFDLAAQYTYLAAKAYDYETNLLKTSSGAGQRFLTDIVRQRSLGVIINGQPVAGSQGLADPLARLNQNFGVLRGQLGFNNPMMETNRFSLRNELFRAVDDATWQGWLNSFYVPDLRAVAEFKRYARPFAPDSAGPQPGLVIPFSSTITYGKNFFGNQLAAGDSFYDPSVFTTKISAAGIWFTNYNTTELSNTPKVYLIPAGIDVMTSPSSDTLETRQWRVMDQKLPVPFTIGATDLTNPDWIPVIDSLSEQLGGIRRFSSIRAYHDDGEFDPAQTISDTRLVGRSVWNTQWKLIIPSATFLYDPVDRSAGINRFINGVSDIKLFFLTYGYSGN